MSHLCCGIKGSKCNFSTVKIIQGQTLWINFLNFEASFITCVTVYYVSKLVKLFNIFLSIREVIAFNCFPGPTSKMFSKLVLCFIMFWIVFIQFTGSTSCCTSNLRKRSKWYRNIKVHSIWNKQHKFDRFQQIEVQLFLQCHAWRVSKHNSTTSEKMQIQKPNLLPSDSCRNTQNGSKDFSGKALSIAFDQNWIKR